MSNILQYKGVNLFYYPVSRSVFVTLLCGLLLEVLYFKQTLFSLTIIPLVLIGGFILLWLIGGNLFRRQALKLKKIILPFMLILGTSFFLFYETSVILRQFVILLCLFCIFLFTYYYRRIPAASKEDYLKIESFLNVMILVSAFLSYLIIYDLFFTFFMPLWVAMLLVLLVSWLLFYYLFWATSSWISVLPAFVILMGIVMLEIFSVLSFWRTDPMIRSIVLVSMFYVFLGVLSLRTKKELTNKKVAEYVIVAIIVLLITISTMRWYTFY